MRKEQPDGKAKKDVDTTEMEMVTNVNNDDEAEEIPDDDSVAEVDNASWTMSTLTASSYILTVCRVS